jgi:alpha-galactosidase
VIRLELDGAVADDYLQVDVSDAGDVLGWSVANGDDRPRAVDRVQLRFRLESDGPVRMFRHGYQSWSACGSVPVGAHIDESLGSPAPPGAFRATFHADSDPVATGTSRSELVTVLADGDGSAVCVGFDGGARHDGTFRVTDGEVVAEAFLGGAELGAAERRHLHDLRVVAGDPGEALATWAAWAGECSDARVAAPYQVGWCSWYQYFHDVTEAYLRANLTRAGDWPIDVFQLDDGYQAAIGDWLFRADSFPSPLERIAADIDAAGLVPGLWLAPFLVSPASRVAAEHPEWIVRRASGRPAIGAANPRWGGEQWILDTSHPAVLSHLEQLARQLVDMGWRYLKLDFTYAPSFTAEWHDPTRTPAERVRAGFDAVRRGAGDDAFVLGCGAPVGPCIGVVDGMRIGPDVAPHWAPRVTGPYAGTAPSVLNAWRNTLARSFQHRRLWLNDPDCLMLRTRDTELSEAQVRAWGLAVAASGGMALISDDLALLDGTSRRLLDEVLDAGRSVDARSSAEGPPVCPDLLERATPTTLVSGDLTLVGDPERGTASSRGDAAAPLEEHDRGPTGPGDHDDREHSSADHPPQPRGGERGR